MTRIGLIGFGEAGQSLARGLAPLVDRVACHDIRFGGEQGAALKLKAHEIGVHPCDDLPALAGQADIVISVVVANVAATVAAQAADALTPAHTYLDLNSVSPNTKVAIGREVAGSGCVFVEGAVMGRVGKEGHTTQILLAGAEAEKLSERLNAIGMNTEAIGSDIGQASANKMVRSVFLKGISALLVESLVSANRYGISERWLSSVQKTFPGIDWPQTAAYYLGRAAIHGIRMGAEMEEVCETIEQIDLDPVMAKAIGERLRWTGETLRGIRWPEDGPKTFGDVLAAIDATAARTGT